ncbi:hypothetical protein [Streptomyces sp. NPDC086519]|uniref:hypothetical protein n=1 Tax=Streptomyces sp. NPDC086519 TaxID=3154863 RepID=UPI003433D28F
MYAELIMLRTNDRRHFIVVEGPADVAVFDRFTNLDLCLPIPAYGKDSAHACMYRVIEDDFRGVFAILDRDWLELIPGDLQDPRIVHTDRYDLDACIFFADSVYEGIASSFCAGSGFRVGVPGCTEQDILQTCVALSFPIGVLRYISERDGLGLNLRKFPLGEAVKEGDLLVDLNALIDLCLARTKDGSHSKEDLKEVLTRELGEISIPARYCTGHDLAKAFSILVKFRWKVRIGADVVERTARSSLSEERFRDFSIYSEAAGWFEGKTEVIWRC